MRLRCYGEGDIMAGGRGVYAWRNEICSVFIGLVVTLKSHCLAGYKKGESA